MMDESVKNLSKILKESDNIVFLGGAGVSTESGIPDFRSEDGIFAARNEYGYPPEIILSHSFFKKRQDVFFDYLRKYLIFENIKPNDAHKTLAKLEACGKLKAVITQNIDNLHQAAGSKNVLELHGTLYKNYCLKCGRRFGIESIVKSTGVPHCEACGGVIRPQVVLYEECLPEGMMERSARLIEACDVLIVGGTSLNVYPAAGLINYYGGSKLVLINKTETSYDKRASLIVRESIGRALKEAFNLIEKS